ncbi:MAG: hypothetical protein IOC54_11165 [Methylobacterium sp.]|jgi:hypothetical protein|nr:hypothetical protein [Methylobacterium sp.]MCA3637326.1 hypothetical protein [Methylobacterium sp.]MCA3647462.1 hypothetical protein [Methylobacterium sp.]MCA3652387.1 hypothetical protein [Methylobacterium sp.]
MPNVSNYRFSHREILELMIRSAGVKQGKWQLSVNFTFSGLNAIVSAETALPAALVGIDSLALISAPADAPPALCMDAEAVWAKESAI